MALKIYIILLFIVLLIQNAVEGKNKTKKAMETKKDKDTSRSANPGREKGAFHRLSILMNQTEDRRLSTKEKLSKINEMNRHKDIHAMLNDNQEGFISKQKIPEQENITTTFVDKMSILRRNGYPLSYEMEDYLTIPHAIGVYCDFENSAQDLCQWQWNETVTREGHGFNIMTPEDVAKLNYTGKKRYSGPLTDAEGNTTGHFLYLPVDGSMGNMVIKSPPFTGLGEFCTFEAYLHQHGMQRSIIRLISETVHSEVQWILQEMLGNNDDVWRPYHFLVGRVQQDIRIMLEVSPLTASGPVYPHFAVDNIRMVDCVPEPPVFDGQCHKEQIKCQIMNRESCIKKQQLCDLVRDCDDGMDEKTLCYKMPFGSYCDFEVDSCGFTNVPQPILKWSRHSGPTPTDKTGPPSDHTCPPAPPAAPAPPLAPPPCRGFYLYVNMNVTGPNNQRADFASTAVMNTVVFNPPPKVHGNMTSRYYNCCMIRFYYHQNGKNFGSLSVDLVEMKMRGNVSTSLWFSTKDKGEHWYRANIFLPNVTSRYFLQFKTRMGMRIYSDSAIDDFSLSPECFGINIDPGELGDYDYNNPRLDEDIVPHPDFENAQVYRFSSCGAAGRWGPSQGQCDVTYNHTGYRVDVLDGDMAGVQTFVVPQHGYYTIIAQGAAGGSEGAAGAAGGAGWSAVGAGRLRGGDSLYILVGHRGGDACAKSADGANSCVEVGGVGGANVSGVYTSRTHEVRNTRLQAGGGGGGGGTYVFQRVDGQWSPLVVGGGGGGGAGGGLLLNPPTLTHMYGDPDTTPGAGGGWLLSPDSERYPTRGRGAVEGGAGGAGCGPRDGDGGFGGGGGGCSTHGGGGGYNGGAAGSAGGSYSWGAEGAATPHHRPHGDVIIIPAIKGCGCSYLCVALDVWRMSVRCVCPDRHVPHPTNPHVCVAEVWWEEFSLVVSAVLGAILVVFLVATGCLGLYLYNKYQKKKEAEIRRKQLLEQEVQLHRLRNPPGGDTLASFNPHYGSEFLTTLGVDVRGLPQVARDTLKLVKALGQGAFGEVYQGVYRHRAGDNEMPVAVKTLPDLSTGQSEAEFLMEAAIMAKFNHPNIVHLIGVCFDRHPRFIVIELLAGGDLKNFLRDSRPRTERATTISMQDLLQCALDVAKGCKYLESKRFIHRDIAARNCLLTSRGPGRVVKIADFGMARDIYRSDYYRKGGKALLPIKWMPPESYMDGFFSVNSDVWSYGVLLWEVFSLGVMPYTGCNNREVMELVNGGGRLEKPYNECPPELYRLMCECWNPVAEHRPTFAHIYDRLFLFLQDPEILNAPLPTVKCVAPAEDKTLTNGPQHVHAKVTNSHIVSMAGCDYLIPLSARDATGLSSHSLRSLPNKHTIFSISTFNATRGNLVSSTDTLVPHSASPTTPDNLHLSAPPLQTASQEYGSTRVGAGSSARDGGTSVSNNNKFLTSNSTDRLMSSAEDASMDSDEDSEGEGDERGEGVKETSFSSRPPPLQDVTPRTDAAVEKLISITPTSPRPPPTPLSLPGPRAPIASPDPPLILPREPRENRPRPLCLDAAQLEHNLNALKKNSGSVNLTTMNIVPPYINVVTPNKLAEKTIQIDPKKAVIYDLQSPEDTATAGKLKQSNSAASLLNGPMTDVPYADSDNGSSSSSSNGPNQIGNIQLSKPNDYTEVKIRKESANDSEISC